MYNRLIEAEKKANLFDKIINMNDHHAKNLLSDLKKKRYMIRQMLFKEKDSLSKRSQKQHDKRPKHLFTLNDLIKRMGKYFFGEKGTLLHKIPCLQKEYERLGKLRRIHLNQKIKIGDLTYLNVKSINNSQKHRMNEVKKNYLTRSSFFSVPIQEVDYIFDHKPKVNLFISSKLNKKSKGLNQLSNMNIIDKSYFPKTHSNIQSVSYSKHNDSSIPKVMSDDNIKQHAIIPIRNMSTKVNHTRPISLSINKQKKKKIDMKLNCICKAQYRLDHKLFKIIDKASMSPKNNKIFNVERDKTIKMLYDAKVKYHPSKSKEIHVEAVKFKDSFSLMNPIKAKLLRLSDTINHLNNETALCFAESIISEYEDQSDKVKHMYIKEKLIPQKLNSNVSIIKRMKRNDFKIQKYLYNYQQTKDSITQDKVIKAYSMSIDKIKG